MPWPLCATSLVHSMGRWRQPSCLYIHARRPKTAKPKEGRIIWNSIGSPWLGLHSPAPPSFPLFNTGSRRSFTHRLDHTETGRSAGFSFLLTFSPAHACLPSFPPPFPSSSAATLRNTFQLVNPSFSPRFFSSDTHLDQR